MKRFDSGEALAKEMGISPAHLRKTFDTYNVGAKAKKDPFGKKVTTLIIALYLQLTFFPVLLVWRLDYE